MRTQGVCVRVCECERAYVHAHACARVRVCAAGAPSAAGSPGHDPHMQMRSRLQKARWPLHVAAVQFPGQPRPGSRPRPQGAPLRHRLDGPAAGGARRAGRSPGGAAREEEGGGEAKRGCANLHAQRKAGGVRVGGLCMWYVSGGGGSCRGSSPTTTSPARGSVPHHACVRACQGRHRQALPARAVGQACRSSRSHHRAALQPGGPLLLHLHLHLPAPTTMTVRSRSPSPSGRALSLSLSPSLTSAPAARRPGRRRRASLTPPSRPPPSPLPG